MHLPWGRGEQQPQCSPTCRQATADELTDSPKLPGVSHLAPIAAAVGWLFLLGMSQRSGLKIRLSLVLIGRGSGLLASGSVERVAPRQPSKRASVPCPQLPQIVHRLLNILNTLSAGLSNIMSRVSCQVSSNVEPLGEAIGAE